MLTYVTHTVVCAGFKKTNFTMYAIFAHDRLFRKKSSHAYVGILYVAFASRHSYPNSNRNCYTVNTWWSYETVTYDLSLTDLKDGENFLTHWFLETSYREVLMISGFIEVWWKKSCLSEDFPKLRDGSSVHELTPQTSLENPLNGSDIYKCR